MNAYPYRKIAGAALCALLTSTLTLSVAFAADDSPGDPNEKAKDGPAAAEKPVVPDLPPEKAPPQIKEGPTDGRVLPPKSNAVVEAAFKRLAPAWTLKEAKIDKNKVNATVCNAANVCHSLSMSDPKADCKGEAVGPWCVSWQGEIGDDVKAAIKDALGKDDDGAVWAMAKHKAAEGHKPGEGDPENMPPEATDTKSYANPPSEMPPAEMDDPSLLLLLAAAFGVLIAAIALFRMKGNDDDSDGDAG